MRVEARLFLGSAAFFAAIGTVYWLVSYEDAGTTLLALGFVAALLVAVWLAAEARRSGLRPEDRDAEPGDGAGELSAFPGASLWPFGLAAGATMAGAGLVFGTWLIVAGSVLLLVSVAGLARRRR